jgi:TolA-binding protein
LRLRLADCCKAQKDDKSALRHLESVASRPDSPLAPQAHLLAGECLLGQQKWKDGIKHLVLFRDKEGFQGVGGVSDRALLLLGHGLSSQEKWDESRVAFTLLVTTYGDSRWCNEARYRMAWTHWKQKQTREAQHTLQEMKWDDPSDMMPKARLLLGCSFAERKKYPEAVEQLSELAAKAADGNIHALALLELAEVYRQTKKREDADKLLKEVLEKHPETPWAAFAKERLKNEQDEAAPHALPAAQSLFAPPQPTAVPLEPLGQQQPLDADTQDPTADLVWTYVLSAPLAERNVPAPLVRFTPVDPFEHRRAVKGKYPNEDALPLAEKLELPK